MLLIRLLEKIVVSERGCWLWLGSTYRTGYGKLKIKRKTRQAHRVSFEFHGGIICKRCVCHSCDTPACINPDHLFNGTHLENSEDCTRKGRSSRRLTIVQVESIRSDPRTVDDLAAIFRITRGMISQIKNGKRWRLK